MVESPSQGVRLPECDPGFTTCLLYGCVTIGKLHSLSVPQCFYLYSGSNKGTMSQNCCEGKPVDGKHLAQGLSQSNSTGQLASLPPTKGHPQ